LRLAEHERIVAVKDAKGDFAATAEVTRQTDLAYYSGDDKNTLPLLAVGAAGVVGGPTHLFGRPTHAVIRAFAAGGRTGALGAPPPLPAGALRVTPLGGLGAIGRNMTVFEYGGRLLVVDCGVLFPDVDQPGVDLILPDFEAILDRLDDVEAIVLTHGHEDH